MKLSKRSIDVTSKNELFGCIFAQNQSKNYRKKTCGKSLFLFSWWSLYTEVANSAAYYMEKVNINIVRVRVHLAKFVKALYCLYMSCTMYHMNVQTLTVGYFGKLWACIEFAYICTCIYQLCNYRCMFVC